MIDLFIEIVKENYRFKRFFKINIVSLFSPKVDWVRFDQAIV
jgi:hypothetical protein